MFGYINYWAVLSATIAAFILGGIWYSPKLFGNIWMREAGVNLEYAKKGHSAKVYILAFILTLLKAAAFALILSATPTLSIAIGIALIIGLGFIATSYGVNYLFAGRSLKLFLIDAGYHILQLILYGIIIGLWH